MDPKCVEAWLWKARSCHAMMLLEEAVVCYDKVLTLEPLAVDALNGKGFALMAMLTDEADREALKCFKNALELDPTSATAWYRMGCLHQALGQQHDAVTCFERFLCLQAPWGGREYDEAQLRLWKLRGIA